VYFYEFILFLALQPLFAPVRSNPPRNELEDFIPSPASSLANHNINTNTSRAAVDLHYHFFAGGKNAPRKPKQHVLRKATSADNLFEGGSLLSKSGGSTARNQNSGNVVVGGGRKRSPLENETTPIESEQTASANPSAMANLTTSTTVAENESSVSDEENSEDDETNNNNHSASSKNRAAKSVPSPREGELSQRDSSPGALPHRSNSIEPDDKATKRYDDGERGTRWDILSFFLLFLLFLLFALLFYS
jgi:hypothetical protein